MRTKEELEKFLSELKTFYKDDFGQDYAHLDVAPAMEKMRALRINEWLKRRAGHLRDRDFALFYKIWFEENTVPQTTKEVIPSLPQAVAAAPVKEKSGKKK